jgi:hypothetical protein
MIRDLTTIARIATLRIISSTFYPLYRLGAIARKNLLPAGSEASANGTNRAALAASNSPDSETSETSGN